MPEITIRISDETAARLAALGGIATVEEVVAVLVDHAQQGVYRPGAWERGWICQAFGEAWLGRLEPDTRPEMLSGDGRVIFDRPRDGGIKNGSDEGESGD